jgi:hypothetical protein
MQADACGAIHRRGGRVVDGSGLENSLESVVYVESISWRLYSQLISVPYATESAIVCNEAGRANSYARDGVSVPLC